MNASEARELANAFISAEEEEHKLALKEEQTRIYTRYTNAMEQIDERIETYARNGIFSITTENLANLSSDMDDNGMSFTDECNNYLSMLQLSLEQDYGFRVERYIDCDSAYFTISWNN